MPQVKDAITQTLRGRREQLMRAAYVSALRNDADVVNYLADNIVAAQGKAPTLAPTAPGAKIVASSALSPTTWKTRGGGPGHGEVSAAAAAGPAAAPASCDRRR